MGNTERDSKRTYGPAAEKEKWCLAEYFEGKKRRRELVTRKCVLGGDGFDIRHSDSFDFPRVYELAGRVGKKGPA